MKTILLFGLLVLGGCGGSSGGGGDTPAQTTKTESATTERLLCGIEKQAVGTWELTDTNSDLIYKDDCTYTSTHCQGEGKIIYATTSASGTQYAYLIVKNTNGATDCMPKGTYLCAYKFNSVNAFTFSCDGKTISVYSRK